MSELEPSPPGDHPVLSAPAGQPVPPAGTPSADGVYDLIPAPEPRRSRRKAVIASTLGVLLVLGAGGAAAATVVLHRPDVQLARAFDATRSAPQGSLTLSVMADASALGTAPAGLRESVSTSSIRYAWGPGTQQISLTYAGKALGTVITSDTHLIVQVDLAAVPNGSALASQLSAMADSLGPDGQVLVALAAGKPVGIGIGPGSAVGDLIDKAAKASSAVDSSAAPGPSTQQVAEILDAISVSVRASTTVTSAGSDTNGDHFIATVSLKDVVSTAYERLRTLSGTLGAGKTKPDLSALDGVALDVDVWVRDGALTRIEIPLADLVRRLDPKADLTGAVTIVAVVGTDGIQAPSGTVTEVSDSLVDQLSGGTGS